MEVTSAIDGAAATEHIVKTCLVPWDDAAFRAAFDRALLAVCRTELDLDAPSTADRIEGELRRSGYGAAMVRYWRSASEAIGHVAHWQVRRNGEAADGIRFKR